MNSSAAKPKPKSSSPIRHGVVIPLATFIVLGALYFTFFFDHHLKKAIEWIGGSATGAEVDVGYLKTNFFHASFVMKDLQITDYNEPRQNKLQLGEVRFQVLWDALLRAKIVIQEASILDIQLNSPRPYPGRILKKPEPPHKESESNKQLQKLAGDTLHSTESQFKGNALGDIAGLLGGADPTAKLGDIQSQLTSVARANELQKELAEKQKLWNERLKSLPDDKALDALKTRLQAVEIPKDLKDTNKLKEAAEKIQAILKESDGTIKQLQSTTTGLTSDLGSFQASIKGLDALARQDMQTIEKRIQLPQMDAREISKSIFGKMISDRLGQFAHYASLARQYLPGKTSGTKDSSIRATSRSTGRTYQFGRPNAYPLFWLQHSAISSRATPASPLSGNLRGDLRDVTTDPPLIGKPLTLDIQGDFPIQKIQGLVGKLIVDHTTDAPFESLSARVASFAIDGRTLTESDQIKLGFASALGESKMEALLRNQELNMKIDNNFSQVVYDIHSPSEVAEATLKTILKDIPRVTLNASIQGPISDMRIDINSNLGDELRKGLDRQLQAKINEARAQIQAVIDKNLKGKKDEVQSQFNQVQSQVKSTVDDKKAKADDTKKVADNKTKEAQNAGKTQLQDAAKKGLDDLKKQFGL
jgi:uncharacterized protein (TIGR03545 family)